MTQKFPHPIDGVYEYSGSRYHRSGSSGPAADRTRSLFFCPKRSITTKKVGPSTPERRQSVIRNPWHSSLQLSCLLPKTPSPRSQIGSLAEHGSKTIIAWREGVLFAVLYCRKRSEAEFMRPASCQKPPGNGNCANRTYVSRACIQGFRVSRIMQLWGMRQRF